MGRLRIILAAAALLALAGGARAQDPGFVTFGAGAFDFRNGNHRAAQLEAQYRHGDKLWIFNPMTGISVTTKGGVYAYAGVSVDWFFGNRVVLRTSFAPGVYGKGEGKDLGSVLEFRSAIELAYRFDDRSRLGVEIYHRSNASIGDRNPGEESLMLHYHVPVTKIFGR